jgi:hypothetical protein
VAHAAPGDDEAKEEVDVDLDADLRVVAAERERDVARRSSRVLEGDARPQRRAQQRRVARELGVARRSTLPSGGSWSWSQ